MIFNYYLKEILNRSILLLITWLSCLITSYFYKETLIFLSIKPYIFITNSDFFYFIYTNISDIFSTYLRLIFFIGHQIFLIYLLYHVLIFFSLGLYNFEYKYLKLIFLTGFFFWSFSIIIFYKILLYFSWEFFLSFQNSLIKNQTINFYLESKINESLEFFITFCKLSNFCCQIFTILIIFLDFTKINLNVVKIFRKIFYFSFIFFATLISPPEIFSQFLISFFIIFLYEFLLIFSIIKIKY